MHGDLHSGNLLLNESKEIIILDFDDSLYHFFLDDLAVILNRYRKVYNLYGSTKYLKNEFSESLISSYQENSNHLVDMKNLENFVELREQVLYIFYHQKEHHQKEEFQERLKLMKSAILSYNW